MFNTSDTESEADHQDPPQVTRTVTSITEYLKHSKPTEDEEKPKKKSRRGDDSEGPMAPFLNAARWIPLSIDPFINLRDVFVEGMRARACRPAERAKMTDDQQYKCVVFQKIMKLVPDFLSIISEFRSNMPTYEKFLQEMTKKMSTTRSNIMSSLKQQIVNYIPPNEDQQSAFVIPNVRSKSKWGWNHPITARLLCPMRLVAKFDEDPILFQARVQEGCSSHHITAEDYPVFLYDETKYMPQDPLSGLFQGHVLLHGYQHIFTGPASALTGEGKGGKQARGIINDLKVPTPQTIAYAAVMIRWSLSSATNWESKNLLFDYNKFFQNILITLNADIEADKGGNTVDDAWLTETLGWWKTNVPGLRRNDTTNITLNDVEDKQSDLFKLKAARQGKQNGMNDPPIDPKLLELPVPRRPVIPEPDCQPEQTQSHDPKLSPLAQEPSSSSSNPLQSQIRPTPRPVQAPRELMTTPQQAAPAQVSSSSSRSLVTVSLGEKRVIEEPCHQGTALGSIFDGELSPPTSPRPTKKKRSKPSLVNDTSNGSTSKPHTRRKVKKSARKQF